MNQARFVCVDDGMPPCLPAKLADLEDGFFFSTVGALGRSVTPETIESVVTDAVKRLHAVECGAWWMGQRRRAN